jgi:ketosteroid isomerase-like protein
MSQENVEIVRGFYEAWNAKDLDAILELCDPEVEVDWSRSRGLEARIYRRHEGVRDFWNYFFQVFDWVTVSPEEFIESDAQVVVPNQAHFSGRDGVEVDAHSFQVWTLRNGRLAGVRLFHERAEALEAVGLSE